MMTASMGATSREWLYLTRALHLRCPECGAHPIFTPWSQTHTLDQWMHPLEGCPQCGYKYEREEGYFLLSTWALNYGVVGGLGVLAAFALEWLYKPPFWVTLAIVAVPVLISNVLFIRLSKALFIAFDHFCDPAVKARDDTRKP